MLVIQITIDELRDIIDNSVRMAISSQADKRDDFNNTGRIETDNEMKENSFRFLRTR